MDHLSEDTYHEKSCIQIGSRALQHLNGLKKSIIRNPAQASQSIKRFQENHGAMITACKHRKSLYFGKKISKIEISILDIDWFRNKKDLLWFQILMHLLCVLIETVFPEKAMLFSQVKLLIYSICYLAMCYRGSPTVSDFWQNSSKREIHQIQKELKETCRILLLAVKIDTPEYKALQDMLALESETNRASQFNKLNFFK